MAAVNLFCRANAGIGAQWTLLYQPTHWQECRNFDSVTPTRSQILNNLYSQALRFYLDTVPVTNGAALTILAYIYQGRNTTGCGNWRTEWRVSDSLYQSGLKVWEVQWVQRQYNPVGAPAINEALHNASEFGVRSWGDAGGTNKKGRINRYYHWVSYTPPSGLAFCTFKAFSALLGSTISAAAWGQYVNFCRGLQVGHSKSDIHYTHEDLENLRRDFRSSRRGYAFI